ncbi:uncharacterized protein DSM5745_10509 [Aspergillus mulundensis]|uniref:Uncharacterized protein n=1 Tax=Aspergillus mulundensis TaxID=1810919 RepID=A0A3D8QJB3_9EURO|nr:Uncharacterized protein DSM5745_10509 [Aspergillus mulundensis]RDW61837.1 Uncharacterized protein DSM5745_10509 [Aspergillus mulundensis]
MSDSIPLGPVLRHASTDTDRDHDRPPSLHDDSPPDYEPPKELTKMELHPRSFYALFLALFYAALVLAPWVIVCLLTDRPIAGQRYGALTGRDSNYDSYDPSKNQSVYEKSERWYHAARVIQAIASVLTLPLTSAICASAAVIFMQREERLTIPQLMSLADRGWLDWATYGRLAHAWKRFGSSFLLLAILVNLLGMIISPLQSILLSSQAVMTPTKPQEISSLIDLPSRFWVPDEYSYPDSNIITIKTRAALEATTSTEKHAQLWPGANVTCDPFQTDKYSENVCLRQGATFENISLLPDPFLAELPSGFHTGLFRQFLPRINSTAQYQVITEAEFPEDCDQIQGAFFAEYTNTSRYMPGSDMMQTWGLRACMPADVTQSPWRATRDRHTFSEDLYLDVKLVNYSIAMTRPERGFFRVTLTTTTGYFELPNYMNGGVAGFLLDKDPTELCDDRCQSQGTIKNPDQDASRTRRDTEITPASNALQDIRNKGPLLTIALALFGQGSFIESHARQPEAYAATVIYDYNKDQNPAHSACRYLKPFGYMLESIRLECISNSAGGVNGWDVRDLIAEWLNSFHTFPETLANAFTGAAYLSHKAWMDHSTEDPDAPYVYGGGFRVSFDMGRLRQKPVISRAGVIVVSALLGVHVLSLLALGCYAAWSPRWTRRLDSFAILRVGGAIARHVPLWMVYKTSLVRELDGLPGWIGDQMPEGEAVGMLGLGGPARLSGRSSTRAKRMFVSYHVKPGFG